MKKSISSRFFITTSLLLLVSVLCLGVFLLFFSANYFRDEAKNRLSTTVQNVCDLFHEDYSGTGLPILTDEESLNEGMSLIAKATGSLIFITDTEGVPRIASANAFEAAGLSQLVSGYILGRVLAEGSYSEMGTLGGIYPTEYYTAGAPLTIANGTLVGYVFASEDATGLTTYLQDIFSVFIVAAGIMLLVSSILSVFLTSQVTRPLTKLSEVAQSFGDGDFSARVDIKEDGELGRLADSFNNMAAKLEAIESSRQSFMGSIAHELRTPMTSIKGFVDGMLDGTIPQERWDYYLTIVSQEAGRLTRLTRSMLDITKLESGEYVVAAEDYDVWETISTIMFSREQQFIEHAIRLTGFNPQKTWVHADPDLIHQVLYNIVDNAIKFTPDNGTIHIDVDGPTQGFVTVGITNTGEGIPPDALGQVFDRFYKVDRSRGLHAQGSGLGLHLCKQFILRSGGKIWVESVEGESTTFRFTLPAGKPPAPVRGRGKQNGAKN